MDKMSANCTVILGENVHRHGRGTFRPYASLHFLKSKIEQNALNIV